MPPSFSEESPAAIPLLYLVTMVAIQGAGEAAVAAASLLMWWVSPLCLQSDRVIIPLGEVQWKVTAYFLSQARHSMIFFVLTHRQKTLCSIFSVPFCFHISPATK